MTSEQLARVFEPFVQADPTTTRRYGGTGLGLSICGRFAALMGGTITVQSVFGQGTTVELLLPR
jgi:signal transduction histidine kinase